MKIPYVHLVPQWINTILKTVMDQWNFKKRGDGRTCRVAILTTKKHWLQQNHLWVNFSMLYCMNVKDTMGEDDLYMIFLFNSDNQQQQQQGLCINGQHMRSSDTIPNNKTWFIPLNIKRICSLFLCEILSHTVFYVMYRIMNYFRLISCCPRLYLPNLQT